MALIFNNIGFGYHQSLMKNGLNITISPGNFVLLLGNNGTGKTTLIKTIARLIPPLQGSIAYDSKNIFNISLHEFSKTISFLFTKKPFLMHHTVQDIVALGRMPYLPWHAQLTSHDKKIIYHYSEIMGITEILNMPANEISDGQLQKALIAKLLVQQTPVLILDEPLSYLDFKTKKQILIMLQKIAHHENKTVIVSSHDVQLSLEYADYILLLHNYQWVYQTKSKVFSEELFNQYFNICS